MILVTGGAGYIGSHTIIELLMGGHDVLVLDNLSNSSLKCLQGVSRIVGKDFTFVQGDILDVHLLRRLFKEHPIESVIHLAGLKAVGESVKQPLRYYENNVVGSLMLLKVMNEFGVKNVIFSSSATVYGEPVTVPITESFQTGATTNPYGTSKYQVERILHDLCESDCSWSAVALRYFNPVGAHPSGIIGEDPNGVPNNLVPYIAQVAIGKLPYLSVYGDNYDTADGTGVRDYIHVVDLAKGHLSALDTMHMLRGFNAINLGTGQGYSVKQMIAAFEQASGRKVEYRIVERREGDIAECYADPSLARKLLGWQAEQQLSSMMEDTWRWQVNNPNGYN